MPVFLPEAGANNSRLAANTDTTALAAVVETSKLLANCGIMGDTSPNPAAIMNAAATSTQISRGIFGGGAVSVTSRAALGLVT